MIAFGCAVTDDALYERFAGPGIRCAAEPDSEMLTEAALRSVARTHNLILEQAAARERLEALVIVDQRAEIQDPDLCRKLRRLFQDPEVAVVGCAGGIGVRSIAWWEGAAAWSSSVYRAEHLGVDLPGLVPDGWDRHSQPEPHTGEVDTVDGVLMGLSPWAVRNIRFDESLGPHYGYDFDYCMQVRKAGRKVVLEDLKLAHALPLGVLEDPDTWMEAHMRAAEKWDQHMPGETVADSDWKARARRAEGMAATARLLSASKMYEIQALEWEQERQLAAATNSLSWRVTRPLRIINARRRSLG